MISYDHPVTREYILQTYTYTSVHCVAIYRVVKNVKITPMALVNISAHCDRYPLYLNYSLWKGFVWII